MHFIAENDKALQLLSSERTLLDGTLRAINIATVNGQLLADLTIKLSNSLRTEVLLRFSGVQEYVFNWSREYSFYNIEDYTLMRDSDLFYLSLDPLNAGNINKEYDNDYILGERISLFEIA